MGVEPVLNYFLGNQNYCFFVHSPFSLSGFWRDATDFWFLEERKLFLSFLRPCLSQNLKFTFP